MVGRLYRNFISDFHTQTFTPAPAYIFFGTPVALAEELEALLVQPLQRVELLPLLILPLLPQFLLQPLQLLLPPLLDLSADLRCNVPLLLPHLVSIESTQSVSDRLLCSVGVPQGTVPAPLLFTLYPADFPINSPHGLITGEDDSVPTHTDGAGWCQQNQGAGGGH